MNQTCVRGVARHWILPRLTYVSQLIKNQQRQVTIINATSLTPPRTYSTGVDKKNESTPNVKSNRTFIRPSTIRQVHYHLNNFFFLHINYSSYTFEKKKFFFLIKKYEIYFYRFVFFYFN